MGSHRHNQEKLIQSAKAPQAIDLVLEDGLEIALGVLPDSPDFRALYAAENPLDADAFQFIPSQTITE